MNHFLRDGGDKQAAEGSKGECPSSEPPWRSNPPLSESEAGFQPEKRVAKMNLIDGASTTLHFVSFLSYRRSEGTGSLNFGIKSRPARRDTLPIARGVSSYPYGFSKFPRACATASRIASISEFATRSSIFDRPGVNGRSRLFLQSSRARSAPYPWYWKPLPG